MVYGSTQSNMANGIEKIDKSFAKHKRERFCNFLKLAEEISLLRHQASKQKSDDEVDETKLAPETKKRRLTSNTKDSGKLVERNKELLISETRKHKCKEGSDIDDYVDCDSNLSSVPSEETYWVENEVVFIPASERQTPLEFIAK